MGSPQREFGALQQLALAVRQAGGRPAAVGRRGPCWGAAACCCCAAERRHTLPCTCAVPPLAALRPHPWPTRLLPPPRETRRCTPEEDPKGCAAITEITLVYALWCAPAPAAACLHRRQQRTAAGAAAGPCCRGPVLQGARAAGGPCCTALPAPRAAGKRGGATLLTTLPCGLPPQVHFLHNPVLRRGAPHEAHAPAAGPRQQRPGASLAGQGRRQAARQRQGGSAEESALPTSQPPLLTCTFIHSDPSTPTLSLPPVPLQVPQRPTQPSVASHQPILGTVQPAVVVPPPAEHPPRPLPSHSQPACIAC